MPSSLCYICLQTYVTSVVDAVNGICEYAADALMLSKATSNDIKRVEVDASTIGVNLNI